MKKGLILLSLLALSAAQYSAPAPAVVQTPAAPAYTSYSPPAPVVVNNPPPPLETISIDFSSHDTAAYETPSYNSYGSYGSSPGSSLSSFPTLVLTSPGSFPANTPAQSTMPAQGILPLQGTMPVSPAQSTMPAQGNLPLQGTMPVSPAQSTMPAQGNLPLQGTMPAQGFMPSPQAVSPAQGMPAPGNLPLQGTMPAQGFMPAQGNLPTGERRVILQRRPTIVQVNRPGSFVETRSGIASNRPNFPAVQPAFGSMPNQRPINALPGSSTIQRATFVSGSGSSLPLPARPVRPVSSFPSSQERPITTTLIGSSVPNGALPGVQRTTIGSNFPLPANVQRTVFSSSPASSQGVQRQRQEIQRTIFSSAPSTPVVSPATGNAPVISPLTSSRSPTRFSAALPAIPIINYHQDIPNEGRDNNFNFVSANGITESENTHVTLLTGTTASDSNNQQEQPAEVVKTGIVQYISPEGIPITLTWTADKTGFHPMGAHLPTPHPEIQEHLNRLAMMGPGAD